MQREGSLPDILFELDLSLILAENCSITVILILKVEIIITCDINFFSLLN